MSYFDLQNTGRVSCQSFKDALDKFGCVFKCHEIKAVFNKYDQEGSGTIDYRLFAGAFALRGAGKNPNYNPIFQLNQKVPCEIIKKVKTTLFTEQRGCHTLFNLWKCFKRADKNGNNWLDRHEFTWALKD